VELRWHYYQNEVTAEQVREHADLHGTSLAAAKNILQQATVAKLQVSDDGYAWFDVPCVREPHPDA
jgi:hypothetical protein